MAYKETYMIFIFALTNALRMYVKSPKKRGLIYSYIIRYIQDATKKIT